MNHYHVKVINTNTAKIYWNKKVKTKKLAMREMSQIKAHDRKSGELYEGRLNDLYLESKMVCVAIIAEFHNKKCEVLE